MTHLTDCINALTYAIMATRKDMRMQPDYVEIPIVEAEDILDELHRLRDLEK